MIPAQEELVEHALALVQRVYLVVRSVVSREWLELELSMPQVKVLLLLFTAGPSRMGAIASDLEVAMPTATGIVDRLVERGLLVRESHPGDRRVVTCRLSDKGQELMGRLWRLGLGRLRAILKRMTPSQVSLVARAMEAILEAAPDAGLESPASPSIQ